MDTKKLFFVADRMPDIKFNVRLKDEKTCDIRGIVALENNSFVVCDAENKRIKLITDFKNVSVLHQVAGRKIPWKIKSIKNTRQVLVEIFRVSNKNTILWNSSEWWYVNVNGSPSTKLNISKNYLPFNCFTVNNDGIIYLAKEEDIFVLTENALLISKISPKLGDIRNLTYVNNLLLLNMGNCNNVFACKTDGTLLWMLDVIYSDRFIATNNSDAIYGMAYAGDIMYHMSNEVRLWVEKYQ